MLIINSIIIILISWNSVVTLKTTTLHIGVFNNHFNRTWKYKNKNKNSATALIIIRSLKIRCHSKRNSVHLLRSALCDSVHWMATVSGNYRLFFHSPSFIRKTWTSEFSFSSFFLFLFLFVRVWKEKINKNKSHAINFKPLNWNFTQQISSIY